MVIKYSLFQEDEPLLNYRHNEDKILVQIWIFLRTKVFWEWPTGSSKENVTSDSGLKMKGRITVVLLKDISYEDDGG